MESTYLSHTISEHSPAYGGNSSFERIQKKCITQGDSCNQQVWKLDGHLGTHIDLPAHFFKEGKTIDEYPASFWINKHVQLLEIEVQKGELINLENHGRLINSGTQWLILKTGFEKYRTQNCYWESNPGISASSADFLRSHCENILLIGFDFISLSSFRHREEGRIAHRSFLKPEHPILILEDMKLNGLVQTPSEMLISPLRIKGADGVPCTVFGFN